MNNRLVSDCLADHGVCKPLCQRRVQEVKKTALNGNEQRYLVRERDGYEEREGGTEVT